MIETKDKELTMLRGRCKSKHPIHRQCQCEEPRGHTLIEGTDHYNSFYNRKWQD